MVTEIFRLSDFGKNTGNTNLLIWSVWSENWAAMFPVLSASQQLYKLDNDGNCDETGNNVKQIVSCNRAKCMTVRETDKKFASL